LFNNLKKEKNKTIYHWHSRAVKALTFTKDGGYLISGGEESVLVLWQLTTSFHQFIPRLGGPIIGIQITPDETKFLISSN
jgi:NET1-associated nuclear protein 1 (U3 small nucleolar RNA-associated protein 17)